jgi:hypothetical protein
MVPTRPPPGLAGPSRPQQQAQQVQQQQQQAPQRAAPALAAVPQRAAPALAGAPQRAAPALYAPHNPRQEQAQPQFTLSAPQQLHEQRPYQQFDYTQQFADMSLQQQPPPQQQQQQQQHFVPYQLEPLVPSPTSTYASDSTGASPTSNWNELGAAAPEQVFSFGGEQCYGQHWMAPEGAQNTFTFQPPQELPRQFDYYTPVPLEQPLPELYPVTPSFDPYFVAQQPLVQPQVQPPPQQQPQARTGKLAGPVPAGKSSESKAGKSSESKAGKSSESKEDAASSNSDEDSVGAEDAMDDQLFDESGLYTIPVSFKNDTELREFLIAPIAPGKQVKCVVMLDPQEKVWTFTNAATGVRLMTAFVRKDGFKRLSSQLQWAISLSTRALESEGLKRSNSYGKGLLVGVAHSASFTSDKEECETYRVAKLKSDSKRAQFELYDAGLNPGKAVGAMAARRELAFCNFTPSEAGNRLVCHAGVPEVGEIRRPASKKEELAERLKNGDRTVAPLASYKPGRPLALPLLSDFKGMARMSSKKNMILHDPRHFDGTPLFVMGKQSDNIFNVFFREPVSPVQAFAFALASIAAS